MLYNKDVQEALAAGYSLDDIRQTAIEEYNEVIALGYDVKEARAVLKDTYGLSVGTTKEDLNDAQFIAALTFSPNEEISSDSVTSFNATKTETQNKGPKPVRSIGEAFSAGWQNSVAGLAARGEAPTLGIDNDSSFLQKTAAGIAQGVGDIPSLVAGGLLGAGVGGAVTAPTGPGAAVGAIVGGGAGAGFTTEYLRKALIDSYTKGQCANWSEYISRVKDAMIAGGKGAVVGTIAGGSGHVVAPLARQVAGRVVAPGLVKPVATAATVAAEATALETTLASMEGRAPTLEGIALAGINLGSFKVAGSYGQNAKTKMVNRMNDLYVKKFADEFIATGRTPEAVRQATLVDPGVKERVAAVNQRITVAEDLKYYRAHTVLSEADLKARGLDTPEARAKKMTDAELEGQPTPTVQEYGSQWLYASKRAAETAAVKRFTGETIGTPRALTEEVWVPKNRIFISLRGNSDAVQAKVAREYMKTEAGRAELEARDPQFFQDNPEWWQKFETTADERIVPTARELFENPSQEFVDFLQNHKWSGDLARKMSSNPSLFKNFVDGSQIQWAGILKQDTTGTRYFLFDSENIKPSAKKVTGETPYDKAMREFEGRVSIGEKLPRKWGEIVDNIVYHTVDAISALNKGAERGKYTQAYIDATVSSGATGRAEYMAYHNMINYAGETVGPGLKTILSEVTAKGGNMKEFSVYLAAKNFREFNERGMNTAIDPDVTMSILKGPRADIYEPIAQKMAQFNKQLMDYQLEAGLISKSRYDQLRRDFRDSVPLDKLIEAFEPEMQSDALQLLDVPTKGKGREALKQGEVEKAFTTEDRLYLDPIESQIRAAFLTTRLAARNEALKTSAQLYGVPVDRMDTSRMTAISYMVNGKVHRSAVPHEISKAARALDGGSYRMFNAALRGASSVSQWFKVGTTSTPAFALKNTFRDQLINWLQVPRNVDFVPFADAFRGLGEIIKTKARGKDSAFTEWMKDGGSQSALVAANRDYSQRVIQDIQRTPVINLIKEPTKHFREIISLLSPVSVVRHGYRGLEAISSYTDVMTRVGTYMKAKEAGYSGKEAAFISRMGTVDFARSGATIKSVNQIVAFLNARIQGQARLIEAVKADPVNVFSRILRGVVIPSAMLALVKNDIIQNNQNPDDPLFDMAETLRQIPTWDATTNWHIPVPALNTVLRIAKPQELAITAALPAESFVNYMFKKGGLDEVDYWKQLTDDGFLGGFYDLMVPNVIPTPLVGPTEIISNYSFFTGNNLIPAHLENSVPALQYRPGTTTTAQFISEQLMKIDPTIGSGTLARFASPVGIDHIVKSWTGSIGQGLMQIMDMAIDASGGYDAPVKPAKRLEDLPFFSTFMVKYPSLGAKDIMEFNKEAKELQQRYNAIRTGMKSMSPRDQRIAQTLFTSTAFANLQPMTQAMGQMSRAAQMIQMANTDPESKREQIENIYIQMARVSSQGRKLIKQIKREMDNARRNIDIQE